MANTTGKKFGGRKKGSKNLISAGIKESIKLLIEDNMEQLKEDMIKLKPMERANILMGLMSYVVPKLKSSEMKIEGGDKFKPVQITFQHKIDEER